MNILTVLREVAARVPDRPALIAPAADGGARRCTFAELRDRIDRAAAACQLRRLDDERDAAAERK